MKRNKRVSNKHTCLRAFVAGCASYGGCKVLRDDQARAWIDGPELITSRFDSIAYALVAALLSLKSNHWCEMTMDDD